MHDVVGNAVHVYTPQDAAGVFRLSLRCSQRQRRKFEPPRAAETLSPARTSGATFSKTAAALDLGLPVDGERGLRRGD